MMFVLLALLWVGTSYLAYQIGARKVAESAAAVIVLLLADIAKLEAETKKEPQDS